MTSLPRIANETADIQAPTASAAQHYREGLSADHRVALLNKEIKTMMSTGNYSGALLCCNEAINLNNSTLAVMSRAYCHKHLKMWREAIADFTTALSQEPSNVASVYAQRGICHGKLELYDAAIDDLNSAIQLESTNSSIFNRGCIYADSGDLERAIADFNKIIADSNSPDLKSRSIYHRSGAYVRLERYTEAIEDLRALLRTDPNSLQPRILLGKALKMVGEYAKAEESVSQARDLDPKQADIYIERGDIRCRMGSRKKVDEAIQDFDSALKILTMNAGAADRSRSSILHLTQGGNESKFLRGGSNSRLPRPTSTSHLQRPPPPALSEGSEDDHLPDGTLKRSSSVPSSLTNSPSTDRKQRKHHRHGASKHVMITQLPDAVKSKREAVPFFGNQAIASVYIKRAQARLLVEDADDLVSLRYHNLAFEDAERAAAMIPDNVNYALMCANCLVRLSRFEEAAHQLDLLLENHPDHTRILYHRAFCYRALNVPIKAVECLTKAIYSLTRKESPEDAECAKSDSDMNFAVRVFELRGTLLHEQKAFKLAVADFGKAISLRPSHPENYFFRGSCYSQLGSFDQAVADFLLAEGYGFSDVPHLLMQLGVVYRLMGDSRNAVEVFTRALEELSSDTMTTQKELMCFRLTVYKALCLLDQGKYGKANQVLKAIADLMAKKEQNKPASLTVETNQKPSLLDGNLQWILKYHMAMAAHMTGDFATAQELLRECVETLRTFAPDGVSLGSALFFLAVEKYIICDDESPLLRDVLTSCTEVLTECLDSPWASLSAQSTMLGYLARGKSHQRLGDHPQAIADFTCAIEVLEQNEDTDKSEAAYSYFRRAWSHKAIGEFSKAADDFETAKSMKPNDPNFSINYRAINHVEYIEIRTEPDTVAPFLPLVPQLGKL